MGWENLLEKRFGEWRAAEGHDYLGIGSEFDHDCPPLLLMGGRETSSSPLLVVSLEPLVDADHYEKQCGYASASADNHRAWNLDYFRVFPTPALAGTTPQSYWRTMHDVLAGYCDSDEAFEWELFAKNYVEFPAIPVHAPEHPGIHMEQFRAELLERLRLARALYPNAVILALGTATIPALGLSRGDGTSAFDLPIASAENLSRYGNIWKAPTLRFALDLGGGSPATVYWRYAFTRTFRHKREGRRLIGRQLALASGR